MATVLCIDDNPQLRAFLVDGLQDAGFETLVAEHGRIALAELDRQPVDVIIADMMMPEMDGLEFVTAARRQRPETPIIAISGGYQQLREHAETTDSILRLALHRGVFAAFTKPVDMDTLVAKVREALD